MKRLNILAKYSIGRYSTGKNLNFMQYLVWIAHLAFILKKSYLLSI